LSDEREQREKCQRDRFNEGQFRAFAASEESKHASVRPVEAWGDADRPTVAIGVGKMYAAEGRRR